MQQIDLVNGPSSTKAFLASMDEGIRSLIRRRFSSLAIVLSIAFGAALALAISATGRGTEDTVTTMLNTNPAADQLGLDNVFDVLGQARVLLTTLAALFTAALVCAVTGLTVNERRREVRIKIQRGIHIWEILIELVTEAFLLSLSGALLGAWLGTYIARLVPRFFPALHTRVIEPDLYLVSIIVITLGTCSLLLVACLTILRGRLLPIGRNR